MQAFAQVAYTGVRNSCLPGGPDVAFATMMAKVPTQNPPRRARGSLERALLQDKTTLAGGNQPVELSASCCQHTPPLFLSKIRPTKLCFTVIPYPLTYVYEPSKLQHSRQGFQSNGRWEECVRPWRSVESLRGATARGSSSVVQESRTNRSNRVLTKL